MSDKKYQCVSCNKMKYADEVSLVRKEVGNVKTGEKRWSYDGGKTWGAPEDVTQYVGANYRCYDCQKKSTRSLFFAIPFLAPVIITACSGSTDGTLIIITSIIALPGIYFAYEANRHSGPGD